MPDNQNLDPPKMVQIHVEIPEDIHRLFMFRKANTGKSLGDQYAEAIIKEAETFGYIYDPAKYPPDANR